MHVIDASSIVYAWDNYPEAIFPPLWAWLATLVESEELVIPIVALKEVHDVAPQCHAWLVSNNIKEIEISEQMLHKALYIKQQLGVEGDKYHPEGVDENDLLIICCAHTLGVPLISNEAIQAQLPLNKKKYKIPAVCIHVLNKQPCVDFLGFFSSAGVVFK